MDKLVDLLTSTFRALVLLSAALLFVTVANEEDPFEATHKIGEIERLQSGHVELIKAMEKQSHSFYESQFKSLQANPSLTKLINSSRFGGGRIHLHSPNPFPRSPETKDEDIPLDVGAIKVDQLLQMFDLSLPGVAVKLQEFKIKDEDLPKVFAALSDRTNENVISGKAFIKVFDLDDGKCIFYIGPFQPEKESEPPLGLPVKCDLKKEIVFPDSIGPGFTEGVLWRKIAYGDNKIGQLLAVDALRELRITSAGELARSLSDDIDIFGLKIRKSVFKKVGTILICLLLLQIILYVTLAYRLIQRQDSHGDGSSDISADALPWFGQYLGISAIVMFVMTVCVPVYVSYELAGIAEP